MKIRATTEGIKEIDDRRDKKGWSKNQNSDILTILSQNKFKQNIDKYKKDLGSSENEENISIEKLRKLIINLSQSEEDKFFDNSEYFLYELQKLENKQNFISLQHCFEIINYSPNKARAPGMNYANWQKFLRGRDDRDSIDEDVFSTFCEALGIKKEVWNTRKFLFQYELYNSHRQGNRNRTQDILLQELSLFNHVKQCELWVSKRRNSAGIFIMTNPCMFSQTWMLRRLFAEVGDFNPCNYRVFSLDTSKRLSSYSNKSLDKIDEKVLLYNKRFDELCSILNTEHLIFTLDVDDYDQKSVQDFINQHYIPLFEYFSSNNTKIGKIYIFLMNRENNKDWYEQGQITIKLPDKYNINKCNINVLEPNMIYTNEQELANELNEILQKISKKISQETSEDTENKIASNLINKIKKDNKIKQVKKIQALPQKLLVEIYSHFKCQTDQCHKTWQTYP